MQVPLVRAASRFQRFIFNFFPFLLILFGCSQSTDDFHILICVKCVTSIVQSHPCETSSCYEAGPWTSSPPLARSQSPPFLGPWSAPSDPPTPRPTTPLAIPPLISDNNLTDSHQHLSPTVPTPSSHPAVEKYQEEFPIQVLASLQ